MSTQNNGTSDYTHKITGILRHAESGHGIPSANVLIYYFDPTLNPTIPKNLPSDSDNFWSSFQGTSLGSVITDANGIFNYNYHRGELAGIPAGTAPGILLAVQCPEQESTDYPQVIHLTKAKAKAGRHETYIIELSTAKLRTGGFHFYEEPGDIVSRYGHKVEQQTTIHEGLRGMWKTQIAKAKADFQKNVADYLPKFIKSISKVSDELKGETTYVDPDGADKIERKDVRNPSLCSPASDR